MLQAKEVLYEAYDVTFGIFNHLKQAQIEKINPESHLKRPLALVALHPAETWAGPKTELDRIMRGFSDNKVAEFFNLSFTEFLELPVEYTEMVMRVCKDALKRKTSETAAQASALAQAAHGAKKQ